MTTLMTMVHVSNMERSIAFDRDVLGLPLTFQSPEWSQFDVAGSALALHGGPTSRQPVPTSSVKVWRSSWNRPIDQARASDWREFSIQMAWR
jgi:catechol 2,3-dioxygenase-like lactoylglutathione lyase family enzyme